MKRVLNNYKNNVRNAVWNDVYNGVSDDIRDDVRDDVLVGVRYRVYDVVRSVVWFGVMKFKKKIKLTNCK